MKKPLTSFLTIIIVIILILVLNINVTTRQGINYQWHTIKLPLYLKILDFFDRHYNYKQLVKVITKDAKTDQDRVMKLFEWTHNNIRKTPEGFPVIDDHVWSIIIRGYGASDQSCDVLATLCNYAGIKSVYLLVRAPEQKKTIPLTFVKLSGNWYVFDPYRGAYFKNPEDGLADIDFLRSNNSWIAEKKVGESNIDYAVYFQNLPAIKKTILNRSNIQSPFKRLIFELKKWTK